MTTLMSRTTSAMAVCATLGVLLFAGTGTGAVQALEPIQYTLRLPAPATHYIDVEARLPTSRKPAVELMMAVWTPGSYLVREFARHVEEVRASDASGHALTLEKTRKNRWRVQTGGESWIVLTYRVYANEQQARTNWVDASFALINGAPTYITLVENGQRPHEVSLELPPDWSKSLTSLPPVGDARSHRYRAPDFDTLADSPIVAGNPRSIRAGLFTREQTLAEISAAIRDLQSTPGRLVQSLESASFDAWIKQYRPDENTRNDSVSYYTKGSVVGVLLDARIRRVTNGARSLDDVMSLAYQRFSGARGYTSTEFRSVAREVAGADLGDFFHRALETTQELDYAEMLDWYGLRFEQSRTNPP
jgi:predicted metalloprotease with PDZ domain